MPKTTLSSSENARVENGFETDLEPNRYPREPDNESRILIEPNQLPCQFPSSTGISANFLEHQQQPLLQLPHQPPLNDLFQVRPPLYDQLQPSASSGRSTESSDIPSLHPHPLRLSQNPPCSPFEFQLDQSNRLHPETPLDLQLQAPTGMQLRSRALQEVHSLSHTRNLCEAHSQNQPHPQMNFRSQPQHPPSRILPLSSLPNLCHNFSHPARCCNA
ncbi:hypothetical protein NPIL_567751 [Nephila pilipes]|uniref:Uncharacterized protein n=1 Tax=Nephila pilipes TaxID=299642 RepID=A0A8X6NFW9_NEPPI|nr:hypothetical protein NPIL_567751 [Nephila pilipes]